MIMKKVRFLLTITFLSLAATAGFAQGSLASQSPECLKYLNYLKTDMDQGNLNDAAANWRGAFMNCDPGVRQSIYTDGQRIFRYLIEKNKANPQVKNALVDSLFLMFDLRIKLFPNSAATAAEFKVYDMIEYKSDKSEEILKAINQAIEISKEKTHPTLLLTKMQKVLDLYAKEKVDADMVMETYSSITPLIEAQIAAKHQDADQIKRDIDNLFANSGVASCENIIHLFTPRFEANPDDRALINNIVKLLNDAECTSEPLFLNAVQALHRLEPSFQSAYYLYRLYAGKNDHQNAVKLLLEAIESDQSTDEQDANMLIELSNYYMQKLENISKAAEYARMAMQKNSAVSGRANLILGLVWGSVRCQGNEVETRAKYWVAVDYLIRARNADPSIAEEASRYISAYSQYFPAQEEAFMYDIIDGASYTVSCGGMRENTTVRTRK
jgi:tetratricopeptide (TPR) repeat protein